MSYKSNNTTGQITTDTTWQELPVDNTGRDWMVYVEGDEVLCYIGDGTPTIGNSFKFPSGAAFRWYPTVHPVYIRGVDTATVVYFMK